MNDTNDGIV